MISFLVAEDVAPHYQSETQSETDTGSSRSDRTEPGPDGLPGGTIQPELALSRPGVQTYVWEICGAQILIEVSDTDDIRVNGKPVARAARPG